MEGLNPLDILIHIINFIVTFVLLYLLLAPVNGVLAQGVFMCSFIPTAMAATTIGGMLGADVATMASFCLLSNMGVAVAAPVLFALIGAVVFFCMPKKRKRCSMLLYCGWQALR